MGGGDKPLIALGGRTLLDHVRERLAPQCEEVILNANGDARRFAETGLDVVPDSLPNHPGPLAGILSALDWAAAHRPSIPWIVTVPGDTPFIPGDLVSRLHEAREAEGRPLACASSGAHVHYTVGLWPISLRQDLHYALTVRGMRSVRDWTRLHGAAEASWPSEPLDPFFNVNTPDELARAGTLVEQYRDRL